MSNTTHTRDEWTCVSVLGGWQTARAETGETFGPVFNDAKDLWDWQRAERVRIAAAPETAAERDRLKAVNAELVGALQTIANSERLETDTFVCDFDTLQGIARAALARARGRAD